MSNDDNKVINNTIHNNENIDNLVNIENLENHIDDIDQYIEPKDVVLDLKDDDSNQNPRLHHKQSQENESTPIPNQAKSIKIESQKSNLLSRNLNEVSRRLTDIKSKTISESESVYAESSYDIVIIGGGATGIYSAIQLRQRDFKGSIFIYEKLSSHSAKTEIVKLPNKDDVLTRNKIIDEIFQLGQTSKANLISLLQNQAEKLPKVVLLNYEVDDLDVLESLHPSSYILHSNGIDSNTRKSILDEKGNQIETQSKTLFNVIQISYYIQTYQNKQMIGFMNPYHHQKIEKYLKDFAYSIEQVVDVENKKVIIRFYVDGYSFDAAKIYTNHSPCRYDVLISDTELLRTRITEYITFYIKFRSYYNNEIPKKDGFELESYKLQASRASSYGGLLLNSNRKIVHMLIGESCFSLPFQRNLRNSLFAANNLTSIIMNLKEDQSQKGFLNLFEKSILRRQLSKKPQVNERALEDYSKFMDEFIEEEISKARKFIFPTGLKAAYLKVASITPWEVNVIGERIKEEVNKIEIV